MEWVRFSKIPQKQCCISHETLIRKLARAQESFVAMKNPSFATKDAHSNHSKRAKTNDGFASVHKMKLFVLVR